jgi:hypothetical protein
MSREKSDAMLILLKELSVYKAMDQDYGAGLKSRVDAEAYKERERRRQEIKQEMRNLAAGSKSDPA